MPRQTVLYDATSVPVLLAAGQLVDNYDGTFSLAGGGSSANTIRNGSGAPSSGLGSDGDFYINTAANTIYGPKTAGAWGSPTSLVGPTGATGPTGPAGPAGALASILVAAGFISMSMYDNTAVNPWGVMKLIGSAITY